MIEAILSNPWSVAAAIVLPCWGGFIHYHNNRKNRLAEAASEFRSAIDPSAFSGLRGHQLHGALIHNFPDHREAAKEFRRYLSPLAKRRFNRAWRAYHGATRTTKFYAVLHTR